MQKVSTVPNNGAHPFGYRQEIRDDTFLGEREGGMRSWFLCWEDWFGTEGQGGLQVRGVHLPCGNNRGGPSPGGPRPVASRRVLISPSYISQ
jgi:hypothetical protein